MTSNKIPKKHPPHETVSPANSPTSKTKSQQRKRSWLISFLNSTQSKTKKRKQSNSSHPIQHSLSCFGLVLISLGLTRHKVKNHDFAQSREDKYNSSQKQTATKQSTQKSDPSKIISPANNPSTKTCPPKYKPSKLKSQT